MSSSISIVYPTRNRPNFIETALRFLSNSTLDPLEVVVVDNSDPSNFETKHVVESSPCRNVRYFRPNRILNMVDNWEFATRQTKGEYVSVLTDKTFILPKTVQFCTEILDELRPDILSWSTNSFTADSFPSYFGSGTYLMSSCKQAVEVFGHNPREALRNRLSHRELRSKMSSADYGLGKICFGLYSQSLIQKVRQQHDRLFHPISPDYTSMALALPLATSLYSTNEAGAVQINTDLSNGTQIASNDALALDFLKSFPNYDELICNLPVPFLYSSLSNLVLRDLSLGTVSPNTDDIERWLTAIFNEVMDQERQWSSREVREQQRNYVSSHPYFSNYKQLNLKPSVSSRLSRIRYEIYLSLPPKLKVAGLKFFGVDNVRHIQSIFEILK